jgi:hypothetical protein
MTVMFTGVPWPPPKPSPEHGSDTGVRGVLRPAEKTEVISNGENGTSKGYPAYKSSDKVKSHEAWGLGSHSFFNQGIDDVINDRQPSRGKDSRRRRGRERRDQPLIVDHRLAIAGPVSMLAICASVVVDELVCHRVIGASGGIGQRNGAIEAHPHEDVITGNEQRGAWIPAKVSGLGPRLSDRHDEAITVAQVEHHRLLRTSVRSKRRENGVSASGGERQGCVQFHAGSMSGIDEAH